MAEVDLWPTICGNLSQMWHVIKIAMFVLNYFKVVKTFEC